LHVIESGFIAEVINPDNGSPVAPGGRGELTLTNLGRVGSPLLRYRTGDLVELAPERPCACGSYETALPGGILGRTDDMLVVRGVNIYPAAVEDLIRGFNEVVEYRVEIDSDRSLPELRIQVEPSPECADGERLAARVQAELKYAFGLRIAVSSVGRGALPRVRRAYARPLCRPPRHDHGRLRGRSLDLRRCGRRHQLEVYVSVL
jgi:phenylacetate-CoA ligase